MLRPLFLTCLVFFFQCSHATEPINVFVSIPPQKFFVERIGGEFVNVSVLLKPGQSPETFDPSPRQMAALSNADVYFLMQLPFESHWISTIAYQNPELDIIRVCDCLNGLEKDPHIWTSPVIAMEIIENINTTLADLYPEHTDFFEKNLKHLMTELNALHIEIKKKFENRRTDYFLVSHASWGYFAKTYGLVQIALEEGGREKGPKGLSELINLAKQENITSLFIQKQHPTGVAYTLTREIGAEAILIDPLSENYIINLRHVSHLIAEAVN